MRYPYTQSIEDEFYDLMEGDTQNSWSELGDLPQAIQNGDLKKRYQDMVGRYRISSRFALMRILFQIATNCPASGISDQVMEKGFEVQGIGTFPSITAEHAAGMEQEELQRYKQLLLSRTDYFDPDELPAAEELIDRALEIGAGTQKTALNREELLRLGHDLDFTLDQMQFWLLRSLGDNEVGFHYSRAHDLIDMYGFIRHLPYAAVEALKAQYEKETCKIPKVKKEEKPGNLTREIASSLEERIAGWSDAESEKQLMEYLIKEAPKLDVPSRTASLVYINLVAFTYHMLIYGRSNEKEEDILYVIQTLADEKDYTDEARRYLFRKGKGNSYQKTASSCDQVAKAVMREIRDLANVTKQNPRDTFHVLAVEKDQITARGKVNQGLKKSESRLLSLLMEEITPNKGDFLFMLWMLCNAYWTYEYHQTEPERRMMDFLDASDILLQKVLLPAFYPPNILEGTMMLSIALGDTEQTPAMVYESICDSFTQSGVQKKKKGSKSHTEREKREAVQNYLDEKPKGATLKSCAQALGISYASLKNWKAEFPEGMEGWTPPEE